MKTDETGLARHLMHVVMSRHTLCRLIDADAALRRPHAEGSPRGSTGHGISGSGIVYAAA